MARSLAWRLAFFYGAHFSAIGIYLPFWPVWLGEARGLAAEDIGLLIAAGYWPRVVSNLLIAEAADRLGERRRPMIALSILSFAALALFAGAHDFWPLFLLSVFLGITFSAILPLGEALALKEAKAHGLNYGRLRLWGSLAFILAAAGAGRALEVASAEIILVLLLGALALLLAACFALPDVGVARSGHRLRVRAVLAWPGLLAFVLAAAAIQASHAVYYGFATIHWQRAGLSETVIGLLWAEGVVAEIILFAFASSILERSGARSLLMVAGALTAVRWVLTGASSALPLLVCVQTLHAASFGVVHLAAMHQLRDAVPEDLHASAQGLYAAAVALLSGITIPLAGALYGALEGSAFFAMAAIALAAAGAAALLPLPSLTPSAARSRPR